MPWWTIFGWLLRLIPAILLDPARAVVFWTIVLLVYWQYRRATNMELMLYGQSRHSALRLTLISVAQGVVAGIIGSCLLILLGVTITGSGIEYLLPVAILLLLIHPRLLCFSYAGGLLSIVHLLTGFPPVNVAGLMGLVAVLHAAESLLIRSSGGQDAVPVAIRSRYGTVAGFSIQRFWPLPITVLWLSAGLPGGDGLAMPDWWPLIRPAPELIAGMPDLLYSLLPVVAVLGYSDMAISTRPESKMKSSSVTLFGYSVILMMLSVLASHVPVMAWAAALFGPLGHEAVIRLGQRKESPERPWLRWSPEGIRLLDVVAGSPADDLGFRRGDLITHINGEPILDELDFSIRLNASVFGAEFSVAREDRNLTIIARRRPPSGKWGFLPVPRPDSPAQVELQASGPLLRWLKRLRRSGGDPRP